MINKIIIGLTAAFFALAGLSYARADECKIANFTQSVTEIQDAGGKATEISGKLREAFEAKVGPPPGIEGEYKLVRFDVNDMSLLTVVQADCINLTAGPFQSFVLDNILGVTEASGG